MTSAAPSYRPDIDGLRALAVIPVCCYHVGLNLFPGGFVGVDVFFVISGYLMGALIWGGLKRGDFTFAGFFERRIRRIFPALFAMLAATSAVAILLLPPRMLTSYAETLIAVVLNVANILFARRTSNYFDAPSELNPLLHTWSLSVEEQFYLVFPLVLAMFWRLGRRPLVALLAAASLASFALSVWGTHAAPTTTFYILPTRAWELLAGALVAIWHIEGKPLPAAKAWEGAAGLTGLALVAASLVFIDAETPFPGATALPPCLGAALLIASGRNEAGIATRLLSLPPMVFIGRISYSLYLWHWPLVVLLDRYRPFGPPSIPFKIAILVLSGVVAALSWRYVEQPFRRHATARGAKRVFAAAVAAVALGSAAGGAIIASGGWIARFPDYARHSMTPQLEADQLDADWSRFPTDRCFVSTEQSWGGESCLLARGAGTGTGTGTGERILLWGDSFASHYAYGFFADTTLKKDVLQYTSPACPPVFSFASAARPACTAFNRSLPDVLREHRITTVVMAANWVSYERRRRLSMDDIRRTVQKLRESGVRVIVIGQSPSFTFPYADEYLMQHSPSDTAAGPVRAPVEPDAGFNRRLLAEAGADAVFDPMAALCAGAECAVYENGRYLFADYGHYTHAGSRKMVSLLIPVLGRALPQ